MAYNVFTLTSDGNYRGLIQRPFQDDKAAIEFARGLLSQHPAVEIWHGARKVADLPPGEELSEYPSWWPDSSV